MARPIKAELKDSIRLRAAELKLENPLHKISEIVAILSREFDLSPRTIWYHLRIVNRPDSRIKYTEAERARIADMNRQQIEAYAAARGLSPSTVYAVGWRYRSAKHADADNLVAAQYVCEALGRLNFNKYADLKVFGFPRTAYKEARKFVRKINGLDLAAPNYLLHPHTHRYYELSLSDQRFLLSSPKRFLAERAAHINANWKKFNPAQQYLAVVDTRSASPTHEGKVVSTHDSMEGALRSVQTCSNAKPPVPTKIVKCEGTASHKTTCVRYQPGELKERRIPVPYSEPLPLPGLDTDFLER